LSLIVVDNINEELNPLSDWQCIRRKELRELTTYPVGIWADRWTDDENS